MAAFLFPATRSLSPRHPDAFGAMLVARLAEVQVLRAVRDAVDASE